MILHTEAFPFLVMMYINTPWNLILCAQGVVVLGTLDAGFIYSLPRLLDFKIFSSNTVRESKRPPHPDEIRLLRSESIVR